MEYCLTAGMDGYRSQPTSLRTLKASLCSSVHVVGGAADQINQTGLVPKLAPSWDFSARETSSA
jgi:hypothetical protein